MAFSMVSHSIWDKLAMNRQMVADSFRSTMDETANGVSNASSSFWNESYTGFQHLGSALTGVVSGGTAAALSIGFGLAMHKGARSWAEDTMRSIRKMPAAQYIDNVSRWKGVSAARDVNGGAGMTLNRTSTSPWFKGFGSKVSEEAMENGTKGTWRYISPTKLGDKGIAGGRFIRNSRIMSGAGSIAAAAAFFVVPMVASSAFGLAGRLLDESHMAYTQSKYHTYDTRDFNNRQMYEWNMNKQNQMMTNMMPYEQNMMSLSRVYHSR